MAIGDERLLAIFDHDGILVDSLNLHQHAWMSLGKLTGLPLTEAFIERTFGMTNPAIFRELCGDALDKPEIDRLGLLKEQCYREAARGRIELMAGVAGLIERLQDMGFRLAVGTSGPRANIELTIAECGLGTVFDAIASLEDITRSKPDPEVFLLAALRAGVVPGRTVVFEDAPVGIRAAKAAGMWAIGVTSTRSASELRDAGADQVLDTLADVDVSDLRTRLNSA